MLIENQEGEQSRGHMALLHIESENSDLMDFFIKFMEEDFDESG